MNKKMTRKLCWVLIVIFGLALTVAIDALILGLFVTSMWSALLSYLVPIAIAVLVVAVLLLLLFN